jgi:glycosyltransferase involved in cell wall biosynthesis
MKRSGKNEWLTAILVAACLVANLLVVSSQFVEECYRPLCDLQVAYRIDATQETDFMIPSIVHQISNRYCMKMKNYPDVYCSLDAYRRIIIPFPLYGLQEVFVGTSDDEFSTMSNKTRLQYYISSLPQRPLIPSQPTILHPRHGSILASNWNFTFRLDKLALDFAENTIMNIMTVSRGDVLLSPRADFLTAANVEPATWFVNLTSKFLAPADDQQVAEYGYPLYAFWEFVLTREDIASQRVFSNQWNIASQKQVQEVLRTITDYGVSDALTKSKLASLCRNSAYVNRLCTSSVESVGVIGTLPARPSNGIKSKPNICIWGSNRMDGQKSIWLQQIKDLPADFRFTWVLTSDFTNTQQGTTVNRLQSIAAYYNQTLGSLDIGNGIYGERFRDLRISLVASPFKEFVLEYSTLSEIPADGGWSAWEALERQNPQVKMDDYVYQYAADRLKLARYDVSAVSPTWVKSLYSGVIMHMKACECSVLVYGNDRGFNSDVLLRDSARIVKIPAVAELLNLFMSSEMVPDVVVAPSLYAYNHESIAAHWRNPSGPKVYIIPPGVDAARKFNRELIAKDDIVHPHADCESINKFVDHVSKASQGDASLQRCFHIAFIARLASEKNVGLFIMTAHQIVQFNPFVRFTLIGDGPLKPKLVELVDMLGISWAVTFMGWLDYLLPKVLASVDIVVNPSIRGWSETFCIANIEVMSMEIPLVTFAVGG